MRSPPIALSSVSWEPGGTEPGRATIRCVLRSITPIFGGSARARECDFTHPVRGPSIRGLLRHWWRALQHGKAVSELKAAEDRLWGSVDHRSPVKVRVSTIRPGQPHKDKIAPYFLFSRSPKHGDPLAVLCKNAEVEVALSVPVANRAEVMDTLALWLAFGGYGSRSRRGAGSFEWEKGDVPPLTQEILRDLLKKLPAGSWLMLGPSRHDPLSAWTDLETPFRTFRQEPGFARNQGSNNKPGRSRWPEPDAIRRLTNRHAPTHAPSHPVDRAFPRAAMGLPIVFHFKDEKLGDPKDTTLVPRESANGPLLERWGSPLHLKPIRLDSEYRGLALYLPNDLPLENLALTVGHQPFDVRGVITKEQAAQIHPLKEYNALNAITGFKAHLKQKYEFTEVTP